MCCYDKSQIVLCAGTAWGGHLGVGRRPDDAVYVLLGGEPVTVTVTVTVTVIVSFMKTAGSLYLCLYINRTVVHVSTCTVGTVRRE